MHRTGALHCYDAAVCIGHAAVSLRAHHHRHRRNVRGCRGVCSRHCGGACSTWKCPCHRSGKASVLVPGPPLPATVLPAQGTLRKSCCAWRPYSRHSRLQPCLSTSAIPPTWFRAYRMCYASMLSLILITRRCFKPGRGSRWSCTRSMGFFLSQHGTLAAQEMLPYALLQVLPRRPHLCILLPQVQRPRRWLTLTPYCVWHVIAPLRQR